MYCTLKAVSEKLERERDREASVSLSPNVCVSLYRQEQLAHDLGPGWLLPHKKGCSDLSTEAGLERERGVHSRERK
jgi:hypothetical protein